MSVSDVFLQETVESQKRIINALQNEVKWLREVIFNPAYNEVDIRLIVNRTPHEMQWGVSSEVPEKKIYLPAEAEQVHASPKTITKRIKRLEQAGAVAYRTAPDPETGNARSYLKILPPLEKPAQITLDKAERGGGSQWEEGKRVKRCHCGSDKLTRISTSYIVCEDCGTEQPGSRKEHRTSINEPAPTPYSHRDGEPQEADEPENLDDTPYSHGDCGTHQDNEGKTASTEIPKLPRITVSTMGIPTELRDLAQWVCWRLEPNPDNPAKPKKMPYQPRGRAPQRAESNDPTTWGTLEEAQSFYERSQKEGWKNPFNGIGIMFGNGVCGTDLDHCLNSEGEMAEEAYYVMITINSYSEVSPSGAGVHILAFGQLPEGWRKRSQDGIEMYDSGRFFTFTGNHIDGTPTEVLPRQEQLEQIHAAFAPPMSAKPQREQETREATPCGHDARTYSDEEILLRARNARNGAKFDRLWDGNIEGYLSQSEADQALCNILAWWTSDPVAIDRLFRQSKLMREKWDRAARQGETYGEGTIKRALGGTKEQVA